MLDPKKSLGQNFLIDKNIIKKITDQTNIENENIVEIGPGLGHLTDFILSKTPDEPPLAANMLEECLPK